MKRLTKLALLAAAALSLGACAMVPGLDRAATPNVCRDLTVSIYFERDSSVITREAQAVLKGAGDLARGCALGQVEVTGLADAVGDPAANQILSKKRAEAVRRAVQRLGFRTVTFDVAAIGEEGALNAAGDSRPLRRRAVVTFRLTPR